MASVKPTTPAQQNTFGEGSANAKTPAMHRQREGERERERERERESERARERLEGTERKILCALGLTLLRKAFFLFTGL